jgi:hypothetical protein
MRNKLTNKSLAQIARLDSQREKFEKGTAKGDVPTEILTQWNEHYRQGDITLMGKNKGLSRPILIDAMKHGKATKPTIDFINNFYGIKNNKVSA